MLGVDADCCCEAEIKTVILFGLGLSLSTALSSYMHVTDQMYLEFPFLSFTRLCD